MKSFETEIKKYALKTRLKAMEREAIRDRVLSYMEYHPLPKKVEMRHASTSFFNRVGFVYIPLNTFRVKIFSTITAIVLIVGVSFVAEYAVPGDVLYLVKTGVNEGVRTQLAVSPYEKVRLETKLMERRIGEARLLASEGKLTQEVEAQIVETVRVHASAVQNGLAEIREDNEEEAALASIAFSSALEVQSAVLNESGKTSVASSVDGIINMVNTVREEVATIENPTTPSFEGLVARIESETTRTYELFETIKKSATQEEIGDIERRLSDVNRKIVGAKELRASDETGAVNDLIEALNLTQKLIAFMTDIDIRNTVTLETLVPVERTPEERLAAAQSIIDEIQIRKTAIETELPNVIDAGIVEKVTLGLTELGTILDTARARIAEKNVVDAELTSTEAQALAEDLMKLVPQSDASAVTPEVVLPVETVGTTTPTTTDAIMDTEAGTSTLVVDEFPVPVESE